MKYSKTYIPAGAGKIRCLIMTCRNREGKLPGILWIHGGGYTMGFPEMAWFSCGKMLAEKYGGVVLSPGYRLAPKAQYPAALEDCYSALEYMWENAEELGIDRNRIIIGGESAGGGLAAAVCLYARDKGTIPVCLQLPLYPMIDCRDTESSKDNHGRAWNTRRNHRCWKMYLGNLYGTDKIPVYASAALQTDYAGMPPAYTFVSRGEPFYQETLDYVSKLRRSGVRAEVTVYPGDLHSFDMLCPWLPRSREARHKLCMFYEEFMKDYGGMENG